MWGVVACALLAMGCGRLSFDPRSDASAGGGDDTDPAGPGCTATQVANFAWPTAVTDLTATAEPNGYALGAIAAGASPLYGVFLDSSFVANTSVPFFTSPSPPTAYNYIGATAWWDGLNLDGEAWRADNTAILKTFQHDMTSFVTADSRTGASGDPANAHAGTATIATWFSGTMFSYTMLKSDGTSFGTDYVGGIASAQIMQSVAASGTTAFIVAGLIDGSCYMFSVVGPATATSAGYPLPCAEPYVVGEGTDLFDVVYTSGGMVMANLFMAASGPITYDAERSLAPGSEPRALRIDGATWVAWRDSGLHMSPLATIVDTPIRNLPPGDPSAYEPAGAVLFAVYGTDLWSITCH